MKPAELRTCARCEWVYKADTRCPQCGFASYGAHSVYGKKAYTYVKTQEPWKRKKLANYYRKLDSYVKDPKDLNTMGVMNIDKVVKLLDGLLFFSNGMREHDVYEAVDFLNSLKKQEHT